MTIKAARVDQDGVFLGMDELADMGKLTVLHLKQIDECDLPAGKYKWIPDAENPMGGAFWPIDYLERVAKTRAEAAAEASLRADVQAERASGQSRRAAFKAAKAKRMKNGPA